MKYIYIVLGFVVSFAVVADPQMGDNGVHFPLSNEAANHEAECKNCDGLFERNTAGVVEHGWYSDEIRMPVVHAKERQAEPVYSSLEADFGCNLVDGDNTTNVDHWRITYTILTPTGSARDCENDFCPVRRDFHCSTREWRVFPELY